MTVYIDNARNPYRGMIMSHMVADSLEELHTMAEKLHLKEAWFQDEKYPHYDLCQSKKRYAKSLGAVIVTSAEIIRICQRINPHET